MKESKQTDKTDGLEWLRNVVADAENSLTHASLLIHALAPVADQLQDHRSGWQQDDDDISILIRRIEKLRGASPRLRQIGRASCRERV